MWLDAGRDALLLQVEGRNADLIGTICAVIVSVVFAVVIVLDVASIKHSLRLLRYNLHCSDKL